MSAPIDIFGALRVRRRQAGGPGARVTAEFTAPALVWHADENAIMGGVAEAIAESIREMLLQGRAPDGTPLPTPDQDTLERRRYRLAQAGRGGHAADHITDPKARRRALLGWMRRFKAAKMGLQTPQPGARSFGVESELLARSVVAVPRVGYFDVFFAAIRAKLDRSGSNAVLRVFKRIGIWNAAAARQPRVQAALRQAQRDLFSRRVWEALAKAHATATRLMALAEQAEADGG